MDRTIELLFVHGIAGSTADCDALRAHLPVEWKVEAIALPGHDPDRVDGIDGLRHGDDVGRIADLLVADIDRSTSTTVLVGHSTGGVLVLDAVSRGLLTAAAVVLIDSNAPLGAAARQRQRVKAAQAGRSDWWEFFIASTAASIGDQTDQRTRAAIEARLHRVPRQAIATIWRAVLSYDASAAWATCPCPVLYLRTTRTLWPEEVTAVRGRPGASSAPVEIVALPTALGHYPHLTAPAVVANTVATFVRDCLSSPTTESAVSAETRAP